MAMPKVFIVENGGRCPYRRAVAGCKWYACEHKKFWYREDVMICEGPGSDMCPLPNAIIQEE
ncbi:MAG: hypothetical protein M0R06_10235 [Sphaerochaeta sp.]|jgi:hypothetical protein|nr:hypothetical protein [Sphaerochaeta sp.]